MRRLFRTRSARQCERNHCGVKRALWRREQIRRTCKQRVCYKACVLDIACACLNDDAVSQPIRQTRTACASSVIPHGRCLEDPEHVVSHLRQLLHGASPALGAAAQRCIRRRRRCTRTPRGPLAVTRTPRGRLRRAGRASPTRRLIRRNLQLRQAKRYITRTGGTYTRPARPLLRCSVLAAPVPPDEDRARAARAFARAGSRPGP